VSRVFLDGLREAKPRLYVNIEKGFVPKTLRPQRKATASIARIARRRAVGRKARI
jgi:predicted metal-binding protein